MRIGVRVFIWLSACKAVAVGVGADVDADIDDLDDDVGVCELGMTSCREACDPGV
jgi:hypothetical protein